MKLEEVTKSRIGKALNSELFRLRLRAVQLHEKYTNIEKKESLVNIDWEGFYTNYRLLVKEFNRRELNFPSRDIDKVLEEEKYFGIKVLEKTEGNSSILIQIGKSNILINPIDKKQIEEQINGVIITKSYKNYNEEIKDYKKEVPVYAIGESFDEITSKGKHLFIKALKIGKDQALIKPIKITYKKKSPAIGLTISKEKTKLSILPKFLSLTKSAMNLIKETVWVCEVEKYDKDDNENESMSFISLIKIAKELVPKKIFIVNANQELLKNKDNINKELKQWRGRILCDNDILEQKEIKKALYCIASKEIIDKQQIEKEGRHKRTECMECSKAPDYECIWANGYGHAWFCKEHFKKWATKGDGKGEVLYVKKILDKEASKGWSGNTNPNIWKELEKEINKADEVFECTCVECDYKMKSAVHCINIKCPECGAQMKRADRPGSGKPEEQVNNAEEKFKFKCIDCGYTEELAEKQTDMKCPKCGGIMENVRPEKSLDKSDIKFEFKKVGEEFVVGGIVYPANEVDSQGHFARQGEVWKALKGYMINKGNIKIQHKGTARNIPILESYFVEETHHKGGQSDKNIINKGDWWLSVYLGDSENLDIWKDVNDGKITGFSMAGRAQMMDGYV